MQTSQITTQPVPLSGSLYDMMGYFAQPNRQFTSGDTVLNEDGLGRRRAQPNAVEILRMPIVPLLCAFRYQPGRNKVNFDLKIDNVVQVYLDNIIITGIVGTHDAIFLHTPRGDSYGLYRNMVQCGQIFPGEGILLSGNTSSAFSERFNDQLWKNYKMPQVLGNMTIELFNEDLQPIVYDKIFISFYVHTEMWQRE